MHPHATRVLVDGSPIRDIDDGHEIGTHRTGGNGIGGPADFTRGMASTGRGNRPPQIGGPTLDEDAFEINLTYEGALHRYRVTQHMFVVQLAEEAATIFHLVAGDLILLLFGMVPQTLSRSNRLSDPPRVGPGATVLVYRIAGGARATGGNPLGPGGSQFQSASGLYGSKILGNFKLSKFDGNARYWKTWDKSFVRYLSIHQLDFVIEESFLAVLPLSPQDFGAN